MALPRAQSETMTWIARLLAAEALLALLSFPVAISLATWTLIAGAALRVPMIGAMRGAWLALLALLAYMLLAMLAGVGWEATAGSPLHAEPYLTLAAAATAFALALAGGATPLARASSAVGAALPAGVAVGGGRVLDEMAALGVAAGATAVSLGLLAFAAFYTRDVAPAEAPVGAGRLDRAGHVARVAVLAALAAMPAIMLLTLLDVPLGVAVDVAFVWLAGGSLVTLVACAWLLRHEWTGTASLATVLLLGGALVLLGVGQPAPDPFFPEAAGLGAIPAAFLTLVAFPVVLLGSRDRRPAYLAIGAIGVGFVALVLAFFSLAGRTLDDAAWLAGCVSFGGLAAALAWGAWEEARWVSPQAAG